MREGREMAAWWHTAQQMALLANLKRTSPHAPLFEPWQFHPWLSGGGRQSMRPPTIEALEAMEKAGTIKLNRVKASDIRVREK